MREPECLRTETNNKIEDLREWMGHRSVYQNEKVSMTWTRRGRKIAVCQKSSCVENCLVSGKEDDQGSDGSKMLRRDMKAMGLRN